MANGNRCLHRIVLALHNNIQWQCHPSGYQRGCSINLNTPKIGNLCPYNGPFVKVYLIPGIGADHRIFKYIRLPEGYEAGYIDWITPHKKETLGDYAFRLTRQMDVSEPFMLVGVSLGGIMAVEIAKRVPPLRTILISSIPVSAELPRIYRWLGPLHLDRIIPVKLLKLGAIIAHTLTIRQAANRRLMRQIDWAGNEAFTRWALRAVLDWRNDTPPQPLSHLHGTRDVIFPIRLTRPTHILPKGGHFFVVTQPEAVNQFLREVLPPIPLVKSSSPTTY